MPVIGDRPDINIENIIYATDFSDCSENAGRYAHLLGRHFQARLLIVHAFLLTQAAHEVELRGAAASQQRIDLQEKLAQRAAELTTAGVHAEAILLDGNPHEVIPPLAEKHAPALTVLGTHGAGKVEHELIGSVAEKVLRSSRWPCWTVGPHTPALQGDRPPFRRILYATDFSPAAAAAAAFAMGLAQAASGNIDTINVIPGDALDDSERMHTLRERYRHALENVVPEQARDFCNPHTFVEVGDAHERIHEHIQKHNIDLLILGIHRSSHLGLEMRTSGAFDLIVKAACPVLTVTG